MCSVYVMGERCRSAFSEPTRCTARARPRRPRRVSARPTPRASPNARATTRSTRSRPTHHRVLLPRAPLPRASTPRSPRRGRPPPRPRPRPTPSSSHRVATTRARASDADADADAKSASSSLDISTRDDDRRRTSARLSRHSSFGSFIHPFIHSRLRVGYWTTRHSTARVDGRRHARAEDDDDGDERRSRRRSRRRGGVRGGFGRERGNTADGRSEAVRVVRPARGAESGAVRVRATESTVCAR